MKFEVDNIPQDFIRGEDFISLQDNKNIYYCHTHDVNDFFKSPPKEDFVFISHNSDCMVIDEPKWYTERRRWNADPVLMPDNLIRWFGQNIGIKHDKIEALPVGIENREWFKRERKAQKMMSIIKKPKRDINLMYMNYNVRNNINERAATIPLFSNKQWVTYFNGKNGKSFNNYLDNIYNHKFVLSPIGGGFESHRLWETLYVGSIPIVRRNINYSFFEDLPICFVDEWGDITEEFLESEYDRIINSDWNLDKLSMEYWLDKIKWYA